MAYPAGASLVVFLFFLDAHVATSLGVAPVEY